MTSVRLPGIFGAVPRSDPSRADLAMALLLALALLVQQPVPSPILVPDEAPFELSREVRDSVRFAWLEVPADHAEPSGPRLRLALTVLPARGADPAPDPIVFLPGGPGASATRETEAFARSPRIALYRQRRAVVLLDPRGHGLSEPTVCPELNGAEPLLEASEPAEAGWLRKLEDCGSRMRAEGVRLETLSAAQTALDLEALRRALGAPALNLIGGSYGTRLAAEAMQRVPATLRSVNLVGPVPPDAPNQEDGEARAAEALAALVRRCSERPECRRAYPRLAADLDSLLARARHEPLVVRVPPSSAAPDGRLVLTEGVLREGLSQLTSSRELAAGAPMLIHAAAEDGTILARLAPQLMRVFAEDDLAAGTKTAFRCNDAPVTSGRSLLFRRRCAALLGRAPEPRRGGPLRSDLPTLVLTGELDPRTPPSYARQVVRGLSRGVYVEMPWTGHDRPPDCAIRITAAFFEDPARAPEPACMDSVPPISFVAGVVPSRWVGSAVSRAVRRPLRVATPVTAAFLLLLPPVVGLPVRELRARRTGHRRSVRGATVALWLAAAAGLVLLGGVAAAVLAGARQHFFIPALGVPAGWGWVRVLPWLLLLATGVAAALSARRGAGADEGAPPALLRRSALLGAGILLVFWAIHSLTG